MQTRVRVTVNGKRMLRSHAVWNETHPDDPVKPGEIVHHKDENKLNDSPGNLEKWTGTRHKSFHGNLGSEALRKWRVANPEKAREVSSRNAKRLQEKLQERPDYQELKERRAAAGAVAAARKTLGTKASSETRQKMSESQKRRWEKRKCSV